MNSELRKQYERRRKFHDVTENGVVFHSELAGPHGADFQLFREPQHTDEDMETAENYLRSRRDVVSLWVTPISKDELDAPLEPEKATLRRIPNTEKRPFCVVLPVHVSDQRIYFEGRYWSSADGAFPRLWRRDIGKRIVLASENVLELETDDQLVERTAAFTEFPRGGDAVRLTTEWRWGLLNPGAIGFVNGLLDEHLDAVSIIFNSVPFIDDGCCEASGGPGTISTPISELTSTIERISLCCWRWRDGHRCAGNGREYFRTCRVWLWSPKY